MHKLLPYELAAQELTPIEKIGQLVKIILEGFVFSIVGQVRRPILKAKKRLFTMSKVLKRYKNLYNVTKTNPSIGYLLPLMPNGAWPCGLKTPLSTHMR